MKVFDELQGIRKIIKDGKFEKALIQINEALKREDLINDDLIEISLLKSTVLMRLGEYKSCNDVLSELIERETISSFQVLDVMIVKAENLMRLGDFDEGLRVVNESEKFLLQEINGAKPEEISKREIILLRRKGSLYLYKGETTKALKYTQESLNLANKIQDKSLIAGALNNMGLIFQNKGDNDKALNHFQQSLAIEHELNDKYGMATSFGNIGVIQRRIGNFKEAVKNYQRSLEISQELGNKDGYAISLFQIADTFSAKGELDEALYYYQQSLEVLEELGNNFYIGAALTGIGDVYRQKGDSQKAVESFERSLVLFEEIGFTQYIVENVFLLLITTIDDESLPKAKKYLKKLRQLSEGKKEITIDQNCRLAEALILKNGSRMSEKVKAQEILLKLANEKGYYYGITFYSILSLCDLLVEELKLFGEEEVQKQVKALLSRIQDIAYEQQRPPLIIQSLLLQSKFSLVEGDAEKANTLLEEAKIIAEESGLKLLASKVSKERQNLNREMNRWEELFYRNAPLRERFDKAEIKNYLSEALNVVRASKN